MMIDYGVFQISPDVSWIVETSHVTLLNEKNGCLLDLFSPRAALWDLLTHPADTDIEGVMAALMGAGRDEIRDWLTIIMNQWVQQGWLITTQNDESGHYFKV